MSDVMIAVKELTKVYRMGDVEVHALAGVSFEIRRGEFVAVIGHSGSGKSTLMHLLGCLDTPTSGEYVLDGVATHGLSADALALVRSAKIGFIFQQYNLLTRQTALRNVEMPLIYRGLDAHTRQQRATAALSLLNMGERLDHKPGELSGGQQQRVAIARALAGSPSVILADEPTGALDTQTSDEIMRILQSLNRRRGLTAIVVTHERDVAAYANRVLTLRDGKLVSDGALPEWRTPAPALQTVERRE